VCMVIANLGLIFSNRSRTRSILSTLKIPNPALWWITGGAISFLALVLAVPFLRDVFKFAPLHRWEFLLIIGVVVLNIFAAESVKMNSIQKMIVGSRSFERSKR